MTVIAFDGRFVAADRQATAGSRKAPSIKLWLAGRKVLAFCGDASHGHAMAHWYINGADPQALPPSTDDCWAALYVFEKDKAVLCYERRHVPVVLDTKLLGAGSGGLCATGAMEMGASAAEAVEIASRHCDGCGLGVQVYDLEALADEQDSVTSPGSPASVGGPVPDPAGGVELRP